MYEVNGNTAIVERFETLPSTNDFAKERRGEGKDLIVVAKRQTGGRGTKGRSFSSALGGLYLTKLSFYENFSAKEAFKIMQNAAVAVCETLSLFGVTPKIKWPNDILVNGKKICGILIENAFSGGFVRSSVVGIGLNICNELPTELKDTATSLFLETGKRITVDEVERALIARLNGGKFAERYADYLGFIGEKAVLLCGEERIEATLLGVDGEGNLMARTEKGEESFSSAEVSLRSAKW